MIIKKLILQNFKSFKNRTEIALDLPSASDGKKVLLIGGMNGGGKTTLLEAVNFCLYGARNEEIFERINRGNLQTGNDTRKHANSHLSIMGKPGVGKTQSLLKILADVRTHSNFETQFIFFDYKGDVSSNENFVETTRAKVFSLPKDTLPINPFMLASYDPKDVRFSAEEKAESFASFDRGLSGIVGVRLDLSV